MNEHVPMPESSREALGCWALLLALLSVPLMALALLSGAGALTVVLAAVAAVAAVALVWFVDRQNKRPGGRDDFDDDRCLEVHKVKPPHRIGEPE
jgi:hypothetical protein